MERFRRIHRVFGTGELIRTLVLLVGLVGMALFGVIAFSSAAAAGIAVGGLAVGWVLRHWIARGAGYYAVAVPAGLVVYGIVLFMGDRLGLDRNLELLVITLTTVVVFNLKFWTLSDPDVINIAALENRQ